MSDDDNLSPQPTPESETPEKFPGGADNLEDPEKYGDRGPVDDGPAPRDLDPKKNPAVEGSPEEVEEGEDKQQEADEDSKGPEMGGTNEPEAGQTDEQGEPEEPA